MEIETKLVVRSEARTFGRGTSTTTKRFVWFSLNFSIRWSKEIRSFFEKENKARPNEPPRQNRFITEKPIYFHSIIDNYRYKGEGGNYPWLINIGIDHRIQDDRRVVEGKKNRNEKITIAATRIATIAILCRIDRSAD